MQGKGQQTGLLEEVVPLVLLRLCRRLRLLLRLLWLWLLWLRLVLYDVGAVLGERRDGQLRIVGGAEVVDQQSEQVVAVTAQVEQRRGDHQEERRCGHEEVGYLLQLVVAEEAVLPVRPLHVRVRQAEGVALAPDGLRGGG